MIHNNSAGYGDNTNVIRIKRLIATEHYEGSGSDDSPMRRIMTIFDENLKFVARLDPVKDAKPFIEDPSAPKRI